MLDFASMQHRESPIQLNYYIAEVVRYKINFCTILEPL